MMENMNETMSMELANEATTDLVDTAAAGNDNGLVGFLVKTVITIGVWEGGKRICKWGFRKVSEAAAKAEAKQRIKQAKKIEGDEVTVEDEVEDIEKTHPIE